MATSDLHAHLLAYDYTWDTPLDSVGLARTASLIRAARAEAANSVLFDNGDFLQGSPLGELAAQQGPDGWERPHPVIAAMNAVGYDAAALGNHEFSHGVDFLRAALADATFPVISTNAVTLMGATPAADRHFCPPTALIDRRLAGANGDGDSKPIRLGLIGLVPPQVELWERNHLRGKVAVRDILESARVWAKALRAQGADLVIALCHSGLGPADPAPRMENAAIPLAEMAGIDAIVAGHTHMLLPATGPNPLPFVDFAAGSIHGKPAIMAGFWGSHLGIIDLQLVDGPRGWSVAGFRCSTRAISARDPAGRLVATVRNDPAVEAVVCDWHRKTLAHVRSPVGHTDIPIESYFARLADSAALELIHRAQHDWLSAAVQGTADAGLPILSAASPFKSGDRGGPQNFTDIPAGPIALKHIADLYVFPNAIRGLRIDGATLREWLERSAAQFCTLRPGVAGQRLLEPSAPSYNFDAISGVTYEIDLSASARYSPQGVLLDPAASRIRKLRYHGRPVASGEAFLIATNNFRASGGGAFPGIGPDCVIHEPLTLTMDVIRDYVARAGPITPKAAHNWRIAVPSAGTVAWFDTGPRARAHLPTLAGLNVRAIGETAEGFLRCEIRF